MSDSIRRRRRDVLHLRLPEVASGHNALRNPGNDPWGVDHQIQLPGSLPQFDSRPCSFFTALLGTPRTTSEEPIELAPSLSPESARFTSTGVVYGFDPLRFALRRRSGQAGVWAPTTTREFREVPHSRRPPHQSSSSVPKNTKEKMRWKSPTRWTLLGWLRKHLRRGRP